MSKKFSRNQANSISVEKLYQQFLSSIAAKGFAERPSSPARATFWERGKFTARKAMGRSGLSGSTHTKPLRQGTFCVLAAALVF